MASVNCRKISIFFLNERKRVWRVQPLVKSKPRGDPRVQGCSVQLWVVLAEKSGNECFSLQNFAIFCTLLFHSLFKVEFDINRFVLGEHGQR